THPRVCLPANSSRSLAGSTHWIELRQGPHGGTADEWRRIVEQLDDRFRKIRGLRISDGDQDIAQEPVPANAFDRRPRKTLAKSGIVEPGELAEGRGVEVVAGGEPGLVRDASEFVPRTHCKTVVTAVDAVPQRAAKLARD